jgi:hypothetical protein
MDNAWLRKRLQWHADSRAACYSKRGNIGVKKLWIKDPCRVGSESDLWVDRKTQPTGRRVE